MAEVFFEFTQVGHMVRVCAVDAATGIEAVVTGPASATQKQMEQLALRKLEYVMGKRG